MRVRFGEGFLALAVIGLFALPVYAADAEIKVEQAWARASIGTSRPAAAFVTITNTSKHAMILTSLTSSVAGMVEVHKTVKDGTVIKMVPAGPIEIPAGGRLEMAPGGYHIMLIALTRAVKKGEILDLTLHFSDGTETKATATVMGPGALEPTQ